MKFVKSVKSTHDKKKLSLLPTFSRRSASSLTDHQLQSNSALITDVKSLSNTSPSQHFLLRKMAVAACEVGYLIYVRHPGVGWVWSCSEKIQQSSICWNAL